MPAATASLTGISKAAKFLDTNPIDWNRTSNLIFN